jgi:hypothetical protein
MYEFSFCIRFMWPEVQRWRVQRAVRRTQRASVQLLEAWFLLGRDMSPDQQAQSIACFNASYEAAQHAWRRSERLLRRSASELIEDPHQRSAFASELANLKQAACQLDELISC